MAEINISLSNIHNIKTVHIEQLGDFKVRELGAGESLDLSSKLRRLSNIITELDGIDFASLTKKKPTKADKTELERIQERTQRLMDEVDSIKKFELETYKACFDDGKYNGKLTKKLFNAMSDEGRTRLFKQIFKPIVLEEAVDNISDAEESELPPEVSTEPANPKKEEK